MKRLLTQFDQQRRHATVATPTCCCCCCCVASIITSTAVTVVNVADLADAARIPASRRWVYGVAAFLVLPVAVLAGVGAGFAINAVESGDSGVLGLPVGIAVWAALLVLLYRQVGLARSGRVVSLTIVAGFALFSADLAGGVPALLADGGNGAVLYILPALGLPFLFVPLLRRGMGLRRSAARGAEEPRERDPATRAPLDGNQRQLEQDLEAAKRRVEDRTRRRDRRRPRP